MSSRVLFWEGRRPADAGTAGANVGSGFFSALGDGEAVGLRVAGLLAEAILSFSAEDPPPLALSSLVEGTFKMDALRFFPSPALLVFLLCTPALLRPVSEEGTANRSFSLSLEVSASSSSLLNAADRRSCLFRDQAASGPWTTKYHIDPRRSTTVQIKS